MEPVTQKSHILESIKGLAELAQAKESLNFDEIFNHFKQFDHLFLMVFLCLPFFQPIPLPGLSVIFGLWIMLICWFILRNKPPWLPHFIKKNLIKSTSLLKIAEFANKNWPRLETLIRPRFLFLIKNHFFYGLNLIVIFYAAFLLALPLPIPATNSTPAAVIFINALGQIEEDGVLVVLSYFGIFLVTCFFVYLEKSAQLGLEKYFQ